jgi:hypothetical protein
VGNELHVKKLTFTRVIKKKLTEVSNHSENSTVKLAHSFIGLVIVHIGEVWSKYYNIFGCSP